MKSLNQLALRLFRKSKFLVFTSIASITVAVSLVMTMALFAINAKQTLEDDLRNSYGDLDIAFVYSDEHPVKNEVQLHQSLLDHPSTVTASEALVTQAYVDLIGGNIYALGIENDGIAKSRYKTTVDLTENNVIITENLADSLKLSTGDDIEVEGKTFKIAEVLKNIEGTGITPDMVIFSLKTAGQFNNASQASIKNETTAIMVKTKEKTDLIAMANEFKESHPGLRVDIIEQDEAAKNNMNSLALFIVILSGLILIVTSIMVTSNFDLFVYKNKNQFAIMRTLGARTEQLTKIIRIQSAIITVAGAVLGLFVCYVADQFLQARIADWLSVSLSEKPFAWEAAIPVFVASSLVIQLFLYRSVKKSSKLLPLAVLQENEELDFKNDGIRKLAIKVFLIASLICLLFGLILAANENGRALLILISGFLLLASFFLALPIGLSKLLNTIEQTFRKVLSSHVLIALQNLKPQVRKNSFAVLSISIVMIITVFGSVLLNTIKSNTTDYINEQFPTPIVIESRIQQSEIDPINLAKEVRGLLPGAQVASVSTYGGGEIFIEDKATSFDYTLGDLQALQNLGTLSNLGDVVLTKSAVVSPAFADQYGLTVGDSIDIGFYSEEQQQAEYLATMIVSAVSKEVAEGEVLFDWTAPAFNKPAPSFQKLYVDSLDSPKTIASLESLKSMHPELMVSTHALSLEEFSDAFIQRWAIFILVLIVLIVSVLAGVLNTLLNNIMSKRKEFAVLRTVGVTPIGIVKIILTQISFYLLAGIAFGLMVGLIFTLIISLIDPGRFAVNFALIMGVAVIMWIIALVLFALIGWKLGNKRISLEVFYDNK